MTRKIELAGPGRHDGQKITLPSETVAVVIIYQESDGALTGDLALDRDWTPDMEALWLPLPLFWAVSGCRRDCSCAR